MFITKDEWLTEVLGKDVYNVTAIDGYFTAATYVDSLYCVRTNSTPQANWAINRGFNLICSEITFQGRVYFTNYDFSIPNVQEYLNEDLSFLAQNCFTTDRFHRDPILTYKQAEKVKIEWLKNACSGKRGDRLIIATIENKPVGFLIVIEKDDSVIIDLVGVSEEARGKKVGTSLIRWVMINYPGHIIQAGTQIDNLGGIKLYEKFGINEIVGFNYILHYHT